MSGVSEDWFSVPSGTHELVGILHNPEVAKQHRIVVMIVVGGPQYRVGSHRQFVITARYLARAGFVVARFDYSGMGDSPGTTANFMQAERDVAAMTDWVRERYPQHKVIMLGLCDGASAILMSSNTCQPDGMILINPWVHTEAGGAKVALKHYYVKRLLSLDFWRRLVSFNVNVGASAKEIGQSVSATMSSAGEGYVEAMLLGLQTSICPLLVLISGEDLTAREFDELVSVDQRWQKSLDQARVVRHNFPQADHTFSERPQLDAQNEMIASWLHTEFGHL